jgi:hypothetical protein
MVSPRKPGAKRGRPAVALADDPDRFAVALIAATDALEMTSTRQAALLAAVLMLGEHAGGIAGGDAYRKIIEAGAPATFEGRADALRKKRRLAEQNPEARMWVIAMAGIFMRLIGAKDGRARIIATRRAAALGENEQKFVLDLLRAQPEMGKCG